MSNEGPPEEAAEIVTISTSNTKTLKICKFRKAIFSVFNNTSRPNFGILLLLKGSFQEFRLFCLDLPIGKKFVSAQD